MSTHSSASARSETPHVNQTSRTNTIFNALRRRAQSVLNDRSIDPQTRAIIRYAMEINDPWLAELVRRADAGESIVDTLDFSQTPEADEDDSSSFARKVGIHAVLCATSVFSVPLWLMNA